MSPAAGAAILPLPGRIQRQHGGGLARLGARTGIVSCLGNDSLSRFLIDFLNRKTWTPATYRSRPDICRRWP